MNDTNGRSLMANRKRQSEMTDSNTIPRKDDMKIDAPMTTSYRQSRLNDLKVDVPMITSNRQSLLNDLKLDVPLIASNRQSLLKDLKKSIPTMISNRQSLLNNLNQASTLGDLNRQNIPGGLKRDSILQNIKEQVTSQQVVAQDNVTGTPVVEENSHKLSDENDSIEKGKTQVRYDKTSKVNAIYQKLQDRLKIRTKKGDTGFQKMMQEFKGLDTFIDTRQKIQNMNVAFQKGFQSSVEVLKIRDRIQLLNKQLQETSNQYQQQFGEHHSSDGLDNQINADIRGYQRGCNLLQRTKQHILSTHLRQGKYSNPINFITNTLKDYISQSNPLQHNTIEMKDDSNDFFANLENIFKQQTRLLSLQEQNDELAHRVEEEKEQELRRLIKESRYQLNQGGEERDVPNQKYFEEFHFQTERTINKAIKESRKIYREKLGLMNQKDRLFCDIKENIIDKTVKPSPEESAQIESNQDINRNASDNNLCSLKLLKNTQPDQMKSCQDLEKHKQQRNMMYPSGVRSNLTSPLRKQVQLSTFSECKTDRNRTENKEEKQYVHSGTDIRREKGFNSGIFSSHSVSNFNQSQVSNHMNETKMSMKNKQSIQIPTTTGGAGTNKQQFDHAKKPIQSQTQSLWSEYKQEGLQLPAMKDDGLRMCRILKRNELSQTSSSGFEFANRAEHKKSFDTISQEVRHIIRKFTTHQNSSPSSTNKNIIYNSPNITQLSFGDQLNKVQKRLQTMPSIHISPTINQGSPKRQSLMKASSSFLNYTMKNFMSSMKQAEGAFKQEKGALLSQLKDVVTTYQNSSNKYQDPQITSIREVQQTDEHKYKSFLKKSYKPKTLQAANY